MPIYECVGASVRGARPTGVSENVSFGVGYRMVCGDDIPIMCIPDNSYYGLLWDTWGECVFQDYLRSIKFHHDGLYQNIMAWQNLGGPLYTLSPLAT